jgi:SNF2 family DNA or RNA helicase
VLIKNPRARILIVAPTSVVSVWLNILASWAPAVHVESLQSGEKKGKKKAGLLHDVLKNGGGILVTT